MPKKAAGAQAFRWNSLNISLNRKTKNRNIGDCSANAQLHLVILDDEDHILMQKMCFLVFLYCSAAVLLDKHMLLLVGRSIMKIARRRSRLRPVWWQRTEMMHSSDGQRLFSLFVNMSCSSVDSRIYVALSFVIVVTFLFFLLQIITEKGEKNIVCWLNFQLILLSGRWCKTMSTSGSIMCDIQLGRNSKDILCLVSGHYWLIPTITP